MCVCVCIYIYTWSIILMVLHLNQWKLKWSCHTYIKNYLSSLRLCTYFGVFNFHVQVIWRYKLG